MSTKYYLSLTVDHITQSSTKYADSPYFDTVGEAEDYLRKAYPARDSMWITTCPVGQKISGLPEVVCVLQDGDSSRWGRIVKSQIAEAATDTGNQNTMLKFYLTEEQAFKIRTALFSKGKIDAIKECREITGWGLKDAKDAVELYCFQMERKIPGTFPCDYQYGNAPTGTGSAELIFPGDPVGLETLIIRLTGNRTAELGSSDKIDIITPDGNHRFSIDELRMIVKFYDATRIGG